MWEKWFVIGTDLAGRKCPVAQVSLPKGLSNAEALKAVQRMNDWYKVASEVIKS